MISIFKHYSNQLSKTIKSIPELIQLSFEEINEDILELQQNRLGVDGAYIDGEKLNTDVGYANKTIYAPRTLAKKGNPKIVDLHDSGEFYESMKVIASSFDLEFSADFDKEDGHISDNFKSQTQNANIFVREVLGINADDWEELKPFFVKTFLRLFVLKFNKLL